MKVMDKVDPLKILFDAVNLNQTFAEHLLGIECRLGWETHKDTVGHSEIRVRVSAESR